MVNEKNINLVENLIKEFKTYNDLDGIDNLKPYIEAIENMLNRNKELEEENEKYIVQLTDEQYRKLVDIIRNDVNKEWKSLVKEKIEELNKQEKQELKGLKGQDRYFVKQMYQYKRSVLQELLEKRK